MTTEVFKGKVRKLLDNGKRVQISRSHSVWEVHNQIPGLKIGDFVLCNQFQTIRKIEPKQATLKNSFENK